MNFQSEFKNNTGMRRKPCQANHFCLKWGKTSAEEAACFAVLSNFCSAHWLSALWNYFCRIFAFVNRHSGIIFSSAVQGPAPLAQDEPLAEMHLHALCRYSSSVHEPYELAVMLSCFRSAFSVWMMKNSSYGNCCIGHNWLTAWLAWVLFCVVWPW